MTFTLTWKILLETQTTKTKHKLKAATMLLLSGEVTPMFALTLSALASRAGHDPDISHQPATVKHEH